MNSANGPDVLPAQAVGAGNLLWPELAVRLPSLLPGHELKPAGPTSCLLKVLAQVILYGLSSLQILSQSGGQSAPPAASTCECPESPLLQHRRDDLFRPGVQRIATQRRTRSAILLKKCYLGHKAQLLGYFDAWCLFWTYRKYAQAPELQCFID